MTGTEIDVIRKDSLASFRELLRVSPDGSYLIPDATLIEYASYEIRLLTWLLWDLAREFPEFEWWTTSSMFERGIRVSWRRRTR